MQSIDTVSPQELDSYIGRTDAVIIDLRETKDLLKEGFP